ncbi:MAG: D-alanine--D-alanine ligase family protein [Eubacteriales bacterium]|nr:D-alanine--D-alanine ligase family protein [Eubacteriales bacterium]
MEKRNIAVIFGGQSSEHDISCISVCNVAENIDREKWNVILVGITKTGKWLLTDSVEAIRNGSWRESSVRAELSPDAEKKHLIITDAKGNVSDIGIDAAFPVLHGRYGEDGTIQGLFELAGIPYVGCGVIASAAGMDKFYTKIIVDSIGIRQAAFVGVRAFELKEIEKVAERAESALSYPMFVKPSQAGSSCGVSKVHDRSELKKALCKAAEYDSKILIEEYIEGREIECAVFGGGLRKVNATGVGEILAAAEFYDYDAKYNNPDSRTVLDPDLPAEVVEEIRRDAQEIFNALDGYGLARVDFFVIDNKDVVFNEINTMPGFTAISMYPMLWENRGVSKKELIDRLIESSFER